MKGGIVMGNDNFDTILQQLNSGQNPTPPTNNSGIATSERGASQGTRESNFGLRSVNEGADNIPPTSDK